MISVVFAGIIKMKDENDAERTLYSLFAVNGEWQMNSALGCREGVTGRAGGDMCKKLFCLSHLNLLRGEMVLLILLRHPQEGG